MLAALAAHKVNNNNMPRGKRKTDAEKEAERVAKEAAKLKKAKEREETKQRKAAEKEAEKLKRANDREELRQRRAAEKANEKKVPAALNNAKYEYSEARAQIAQDIIDEYIPQTGPFDSKEIFNTLYANDERFKNFPYSKEVYDRRIKSLRKGITANLKEAQDDHAAVLEDLLKYPPKDKNIRGQLRWEGSAAERLLEQDITDKLNEGVAPSVFQATRNEYLLFDLDVFTKQIHQVTKALKPHNANSKQHRRKKRHYGKKELSRKEAVDNGNELYQTKKRSLSSKVVARTNKSNK